MIKILTCKIGEKYINCYDNTYSRDELKKWAKKGILLCPTCNKPYEYCHGKVRLPYFRHKDKEICNELYSEPETDEHINGKIQLCEWIKNQSGVTDVILEGWLPETKQRPDIMFKYNGEQYVIEYQCTPISSEYYERRNLYKAGGIKDIWICGTEKYFQYYHEKNGRKRINTLESDTFIYYNSTVRLFYILDKDMDNKTFNSICNKKKKNVFLMENPFEIKRDKENYYIVKDIDKCYSTRSYYPSGRPSRKYRYPIKDYKFHENVSLAKCILKDECTIENII